MTNVHAKESPRQQLQRERLELEASTLKATDAGLDVKPCHLCGAPVVWCTTSGRVKRGTAPAAVEVVAAGAGHVVIEKDLIACAGAAPCAYVQQAATRYTWHECPGAISHVGAARARKVRP